MVLFSMSRPSRGSHFNTSIPFPFLSFSLKISPSLSFRMNHFETNAKRISREQTDENEQPPFEPFLSEKAGLFRFSRSAKASPAMIAKYEQQRLQQQAEKDQLNRQQQQQVDLANQNEQQNQQQVVANEAPDFSGVAAMGKTTGEMVTSPQVTQVAQDDSQQQRRQRQQQKSKSSSSSSSKSASAKKSALTKTITTTTTTTTTTQNNQDQPQVAQIKEIRIHTVPLSQAVHYANYMVVPTSSGASQAAHLEESSSSSSSSSQRSSSSSTTSETEQVAVAPAPTVMINPPPAAVTPDCILHRMIVERPVSSQLVVNVAPEVKLQHSSSSSSSHSSKIVSESAMAAPEVHNVYTVTRVFRPAPIMSARMIAAAPSNDGHLKEEHFRSESHSREESNGLGHSMSSSSSSSSSRTSKSSSSTTSQTAALVGPPPPVQTMTIVRQPAPLMAVKAPPMVQIAPRSNDVSVNVDHHQSGPNYNFGYSIKQHSSEPGTKGVVVGERVVYLKK